ncbi:MAG: tripartite tricarboxylate transporter TctB family protein [Desulfovibrionaceae bacterium]
MLIRNENFWLSLVFMAISVTTFITASGYDDMPARFPKLLALVFALLSVILLVQTWLKARREPTRVQTAAMALGTPILVALGMAGYATALEFAGFIAPSALLMVYVGWVLGYRRAGLLLLVSLLFVLFVWGVFGVLLGVPLPRLFFLE